MAETPAEVRRDIELTRQRMSGAIEELERKLNVQQMINDHPWPALAAAFGAGVLLSSTKADVKAAAATAEAAQGAGPKLGAALDTLVANVMTAATQAVQGRVDTLVSELTSALGANGKAPAVDKSVPRAD